MHEVPLEGCTIIAWAVFAAALDSLRRSSDRSSLQYIPSALFQAIFVFAVEALLSSRCFTPLSRIASAAAMSLAAIACCCRASNAA